MEIFQLKCEVVPDKRQPMETQKKRCIDHSHKALKKVHDSCLQEVMSAVYGMY